ncbi:MAG: hybrid sensor histidine kinase/response regulator [Chloroflexi bacterium]|nr:hybrid sensor histidine kinase/response regulator [Chloroflexota bacterium]
MAKKENGFLKRLLATFKLEAAEHVKNMSAGLIGLEKAPTPEKQAELIETVFREAHSLKGAARSVNIAEIEGLCQSLESIFAALKRQELALSTELMDILHLAVDNLSVLLPAIEGELTSEEKARVLETVKLLASALKGAPFPARQPETPQAERQVPLAAEKPTLTETVRIASSRLEAILLEAEELLAARLAADQLAAELRELTGHLAAWEAQWARLYPDVRGIRRSLEAKDKSGQDKSEAQVTRLLDFLDWNYSGIKVVEEQFGRIVRTAERDRHDLANVTDNLLLDMKKVLMLPFASLVETLPKFVRDLSREQGKDINLVISGQDIEIDRRILEEMRDPLMHLVRNCVDHGIEKPEDRSRKGKPPQGTITVAISQKTSSNVEILVEDDGAGINTAEVRKAAVKRGVISAEEDAKLSEREALSLLGRSGVSTSPIITDISGRGLGLAIVREKVEKVRGTVSIETHPGAGTAFRITLPLTVATFRGVIVRLGERLFALPTSNVARALRAKRDEIRTVENRETIRFDGQVLSLVRLGDVLELPGEESDKDSPDYMPVLVVAHAEKRLAFLVDEIINEQEVLVKGLGPQLSRVRNILGVSVLATGRMAPVLNVADLVKSAVKAAPARVTATKAAEPKKKPILVVEDSITARMLLKNILEAAGYYVKTAIDGVDAFTILKTESFDLVVSDVDMPRMNGFDLTAKIRADRKLAEMPVVLVTALESREHRERGVEVGANAYIVKSSFDQSNLLEVIRRLI